MNQRPPIPPPPGPAVAAVRSYKLRRGRLGPASVQALDRLRDRYLPGDLPRPGRPLVVEIGSGMGEAAVACALAEPGTDLLAVEVHTPGVAALVRRIEEAGLTNVRVVEGDAVDVLHGLPAGSVSDVRLWFPDPWPKSRHAKRRFVQPATVELVAGRLAPGGRWHLASDWPEYVEHALPLLALRFDAAVVARPAGRPVTRFEARAVAAGRPTQDVLAVLRP